MKTLQKALDILELVSAAGGLPRTPSDIAGELGLNLSSCTRMMQTLAERAYLIQLSRKTGYVTGPAIAALGCRRNRYGEMVAAAREPVRLLAQRIRAMVNLSIIYRDRRYLLYHFGYTPGIEINHTLATPWNYPENATEQLLLAAASPEERRRVIAETGLPDGFKTSEEFEHRLDTARQAGKIKFYSHKQQLWIGGALCEPHNYPACALGFGVPSEPEVELAVEAATECAAEIRKNLQAGQWLP